MSDFLAYTFIELSIIAKQQRVLSRIFNFQTMNRKIIFAMIFLFQECDHGSLNNSISKNSFIQLSNLSSSTKALRSFTFLDSVKVPIIKMNF